MSKRPRIKEQLPIIGWREWIHLPELADVLVKAKIDTGARSSAIHAFDIREHSKEGKPWIRFSICPLQRNRKVSYDCEAPLLEYRRVKSSGGHQTVRPVVMTRVHWKEYSWLIELTLASRDTMGFRMLLGRQAIRRKALVDPGKSFLGPKSYP